MRKTLLVLLLAAGAARAEEPLRLSCEAEDGTTFALRLSDPSPEGPRHCLDQAAAGWTAARATAAEGAETERPVNGATAPEGTAPEGTEAHATAPADRGAAGGAATATPAPDAAAGSPEAAATAPGGADTEGSGATATAGTGAEPPEAEGTGTDGTAPPGTPALATLGSLRVAACAPQGGWGLTEGAAARPAADSAEAAAFAGPRFFARLGPSEFVAAAAAGPGLAPVLEIGGPTAWRLRLSLASGEGTVFTEDGAIPVRCHEAP